MQKVTLNDKSFSLCIPSDEIQKAISVVAERLNRDFAGNTPVFLIILNGSFMFAADLLKRITFDCEVSFVKLASYSGVSSTEHVKKLIGLNESLKGRTVIIVEDIIDSGLTVENMLEQLAEHNAADVKIVTLLFKPDAFRSAYKVDYVGISIPNDFIVGYGLDYDGLGRNLPDIYKIIE